MKRCIYLKGTEPDLQFESEEHIFPAGIGGIQKLPEEYVSHNVNNGFSSIELRFMRESLLSLPRQFHGPGKRGKLNPKWATKSQICLMQDVKNPNVIELGFIVLGKPKALDQLKINTETNSVIFTTERTNKDDQKQFYDFQQKLKGFNEHYILHEDNRLKEEEFIIGYEGEKSRWHLAVKNTKIISNVFQIIQAFNNESTPKIIGSENVNRQVSVSQSLQISENEYFRICAKIAFNYLAFTKGQEFVLQDNFDPIRNWIVNGGENQFAGFIKEPMIPELLKEHTIPDFAHTILISRYENEILAFINFYGDSFETMIKLSTNFKGEVPFLGYICDWKNRREFNVYDLMQGKID
ncbi:hypothetical protein ACTFQO_25135 [Bacillus cereus group sp. MYBK29-1]|uniref:hypothetical protein n=1 Tax=Bacillus cereus group TaxID=86661 RepID=UPI003D25DEDF